MSPEELLYERLRGAEKVLPTAPSEGSVAEHQIALGDPDVNAPITVRNLFTHQDVHPVVLDFALLRAFGLDWLGWDTPTIWAEVHRVFQTQISEHARVKVQSVKTLHVTQLPWQKWQVFEKIVQGLNNNIPRFDMMQAPTIEQLYVAIDIIDEVRREPYSSEVRRYMAAAVLNEDVTYVPPPLDFIQDEVSMPVVHCNDCGNDDLALFHDGVCDTCTGKFDPGNGLGSRPDPELLAQGKGKNITVTLTHDPDKVQALWESMKGKTTDEASNLLEETAEGTQVAKLLVSRDYLNVRRRQLATQLTSLKTWLGAV